jgi:hypothetical protein
MIKALSLGDVRAEQDQAMLNVAFYESPDYRTLIESDAKALVVGRRGTGKSALFWKLAQYYDADEKTDVIKVAPDEHDTLALRPLADELGGSFTLIRATLRLIFRYALMMELAGALSTRFKFQKSSYAGLLQEHLPEWRSKTTFFGRVRACIHRVMAAEPNPAARVGAVAEVLQISQIEDALRDALRTTNRQGIVLIDRTDEGYEPDDKGIGIVDGLAQASIDIRDRISGVRSILFLRDNIYRAVEQRDQDFSRNLEQAVLRLHWDETALLNLAANRLRVAFHLKAEKSLRVWDSVTQGELQGDQGFQFCLRLTLYRPRDLLLLLNEAFRHAASEQRPAIMPTDIDMSARSISESRLSDLIKEYSNQLPGLGRLVPLFAHRDPAISLEDASDLIRGTLVEDSYEPIVQQQFALFNDPVEAVRGLYSVGFIGVRDRTSGNYVFCHDGRKPDKDLLIGESLMVHPCYWMALNLNRSHASESEISEIYDEYDVSVASETPSQRAKSIGQLEAALREIEEGEAGWSQFEQWCLRVVRVLFAAGLRNIQLNPNAGNLQRRDVIGTNHGATPFWRRVLEEYDSRQVIFECKNFRELKREQYWQMNSYLCQDYGRIGFFITRDDDINLRNDRELGWARELKHQHGKVVIKLTADYLVRLLGKVRSPAKHDAADDGLDSLLDTYVRNYYGEQVVPRKKRRSH